MTNPSGTGTKTKCLNCGFEADSSSEEWKTTAHPPLGTLTQCPECSSTNTTSLR
jgi:hypothetical protein